MTNAALVALRTTFFFVAIGLGVGLINSNILPRAGLDSLDGDDRAWHCSALAVIGLDIQVRKKQLDTISAVYFGLIVGLFLTYVVRLALTPLPSTAREDVWIELSLGMVLCYTCISLLLQTKDDFRFIIPYVEFAKEVKGLSPTFSTPAW